MIVAGKCTPSHTPNAELAAPQRSAAGTSRPGHRIPAPRTAPPRRAASQPPRHIALKWIPRGPETALSLRGRQPPGSLRHLVPPLLFSGFAYTRDQKRQPPPPHPPPGMAVRTADHWARRAFCGVRRARSNTLVLGPAPSFEERMPAEIATLRMGLGDLIPPSAKPDVALAPPSHARARNHAHPPFFELLAATPSSIACRMLGTPASPRIPTFRPSKTRAPAQEKPCSERPRRRRECGSCAVAASVDLRPGRASVPADFFNRAPGSSSIVTPNALANRFRRL